MGDWFSSPLIILLTFPYCVWLSHSRANFSGEPVKDHTGGYDLGELEQPLSFIGDEELDNLPAERRKLLITLARLLTASVMNCHVHEAAPLIRVCMGSIRGNAMLTHSVL